MRLIHIMKKTVLYLIALLVCNTGTYTQDAPSKKNPPDDIYAANPLDTSAGGLQYKDEDMWRLLEEWRRDTNGCLGLRNIYKIPIIVEHLELDKRTGAEVRWVLGPPNKQRKYGIDSNDKYGYYYMRWHYDVSCEDGKLQNASTCDLEFIVSGRTDSVIQINQPCWGG